MLSVANAARHASVVLSIQTKNDGRCCSLDHLVSHAITMMPSSDRATAKITDRYTEQLKCCSQLGLIQDQPSIASKNTL